MSPHTCTGVLTEEEIDRIDQLARSRYESWDWIYGYSPKYRFQNSFKLAGVSMQLDLQVEKGIITDIRADIDPNDNPVFALAVQLLRGTRHDFHSINRILSENEVFKSDPSFNIPAFSINLF